MKWLILVFAGVAALSACSDMRERRTAAIDNSAQQPDLTLPDTVSLSDTSFTVPSRSTERVLPVEQVPPPPRRRSKPTRPVRPAKPPVDTSTRAYAPNTPRDTVPAPDSIAAAPTPAPAVDSAVTTAPSTTVGGASARTLPVGTEIHAALEDSISSRRDSVGQIVSAHVMENVTSPDGRTLIAAGAPVRFTITRLMAAKSKSSQGRLTLRVDGIALDGQLRPVKADVRPIPRELRGRGITGKEAAKVGVGAAGGAVLGRVVGGNTRGAVIGGVAGAAAGAVVANQTASRDVIVKAKTPVVIVLTEPLIAP